MNPFMVEDPLPLLSGSVKEQFPESWNDTVDPLSHSRLHL